MTNRDLKKKRMLMYFIEAAQKIMETEGIDAITLRKVADIAGYNSATLYNYFKNLDHLLLFASMKYLKLYNVETAEKVVLCGSEREKFYTMWMVFCKYSFMHPQPFHRIFFNKHSSELDAISKQYYEIFPEDLGGEVESLSEIFSGTRLDARNRIALDRLARQEALPWKNIDLMNEMMIALYHDLLLQRISESDGGHDADYYTAKMKDYIDFIIGNAR